MYQRTNVRDLFGGPKIETKHKSSYSSMTEVGLSKSGHGRKKANLSEGLPRIAECSGGQRSDLPPNQIHLPKDLDLERYSSEIGKNKSFNWGYTTIDEPF